MPGAMFLPCASRTPPADGRRETAPIDPGATRDRPQSAHRAWTAALLLIALALLSADQRAHAATTLDSQRALYRSPAAAIARGDRNALARARSALADYPLLPYLELAELRAR